MQIALIFFVFFSALGLFFSPLKLDKASSVLIKLLMTFFYVLFWFYFIGLRDFSVGSDTHAYIYFFNSISGLSLFESISFNRFEPGFSFFSSLASVLLDESGYLAALAVVMSVLTCVVCFNFFCARLFILLLVAYLGFFVSINLGTNIVRQGMAAAWVLLFYIFMANGEKNRSLAMVFVASLFHATSVILLIPWLIMFFTTRIKLALWIWLFSTLFSIVGLLEGLVLSFIDITGFASANSHIVNLLGSGTSNYQTGFRVDFFAFSSLPIVFYSYALILKKEISRKAGNILFVYLILNSIFMLMLFIPYSDRVAIYSWVAMPVIVAALLSSPSETSKGACYKMSVKNQNMYYVFFAFYIILGVVSYQFYPLMNISQNVF